MPLTFFLAFGHQGLQGQALGGEPIAVIDELGVAGDEGVAQMHHLAVEGEGLHLTMREMEDGAAWRLIDAAGFHADVTVLDHINTADAVLAAEPVEALHHAQRIERFAVQGDAVAFLKIQRDILGPVRGVLGGDTEFEHLLVIRGEGVHPRIFKDAGLERDMEEVAVHRVGLLG